MQWLDRASAQALAFVARRIAGESVALVFARRESDRCPADFEGIPELAVEQLSGADSRALLAQVVSAPLDDRVRDQIIDEARGNPFALLEFARSLSPQRLAGGFGLPGAASAPRRVEASLLGRLGALPEQTRRLLLIAAAEPAGDTGLLWRAAERLAIGREAGDPAARAELAEFEGTVRFSHPIVRSVVYRAASAQDRRAVHRTLADASDPGVDADRRAWHLAHGAPTLDDEVAAELAELCRPRAGPRRARRGRRVPGARGRADDRPSPALRPCAGSRSCQTSSRRRRACPRAAGLRPPGPTRRAPGRARADARRRDRGRRQSRRGAATASRSSDHAASPLDARLSKGRLLVRALSGNLISAGAATGPSCAPSDKQPAPCRNHRHRRRPISSLRRLPCSRRTGS